MWDSVMEVFKNDNMELHKERTLEHMRDLWRNWRGDLKRWYIKPFNSLDVILSKVPLEMDKTDWEWLAKNHFLIEDFKKVSNRNSINRAKYVMPHRTGSKPFREIIYQNEGKDGNPPNLATIFYETRKKGEKLVDAATEKYDEIIATINSDPSLSNVELVEKCIGPLHGDRVFFVLVVA